MHHRCRTWPRARLLCLALAATLPLAVHAQSATADGSGDDHARKKATTLDAVNVRGQQAPAYTVDQSSAATRLPLTLRDTPQSISVITAQRMADQDLTDVRAVLDNTTGVSSTAYDTERVIFWSRGFMIENMAYDGVPVASSLNAQSADGSLDTSIYERIEVIRGATGLLSGAGSPSAMVNFVRKHADGTTPQADVALDYGSWNTRRISADGTTPLNASGSVRARLVATHEDGDSYLDRYHNWKNVLYAVVDADLGRNTVLGAGYDYQKTKPTGVTWGSFPDFYDDGTLIRWPRSFSSAADWTYWNNTTQTAFVQLRHDFDNGWQLHAEAGHRKTDADSALFYVYGFPSRETGEGVTPYAYKSFQRGRQNMVDLYATGPFQAFGREQELVIGFNGSDYSNDYFDYPNGALPDPGNFLQWTGRYPYPDFAPRPEFVSDARIRQQGLYAAARLSLADPLKLVVGARYSRWKNDTDDAFAGIYHESQSKTLPYAGVIYDITPAYSAFASYTKIFDPQTSRYADGGYLEPMIGSSREIGIKGRHFDGALNTSLTFFDTRMSNVAEALPGVYLPDGITQAYTSFDGTRSRGYELEASGRFTDHWNGTIGWSHFNIKAPGEGAIHTALPRVLVRAFTTYQLPGGWSRLTVGGGFNWQDASKAPVDGPSGTQYVRQSSVLLLGAMARYAFNDHASLQVNGDNLLNRKYFVLDDYSNFYNAPPMNFMVSFSYRFF
ncbi:TonB-dependent siderophore receptor [Fulvimonas soli]|uniref:Outer membrane receptor for ferric coprogen and ferric-rhodotorulic acid n=1 Tax=Fulvimonas soli TaxID=155197 RepID=A0A316HYQ6_9GAMM|nr:TonB-dependent siderophore receptor [Fulvimonas soli]PWK85300.1 outer membrane receptor for ferric coprogen and ferric-rhodotorulic acid [Fulvimonas soli]TNY26277.1 TonB-dependent siderophore receptor [Fulvimonas soli]